MKTMSKQALALFTALALVAGCEAREKPADRKPDETRKSPDAARPPEGDETNKEGKGKYATVNDLKMYYEIHGTGRPLVLLHGAFGWATVRQDRAYRADAL